VKIGSDIVGIRLREYKTRVSWRQTTNYAAATGDMNPCYVDDLREGGIIAPPMFAVAVTWPVVENLLDYADIPCSPEVFSTMVHYTEHIEFLRPIRPGHSLLVRGEVAAVVPHRLGTHLVLKFTVADPEGVPYHVEYMGAVLRGVECADGGRGGENLPAWPKPEPQEPPVWQEAVYISPEAPYVYDGCTGIVFAIHTSPAFARSVGLPGIILQGTATLASSVSRLVNREAGGNPARLRAVTGRFTAMVPPDSHITVRLDGRRVTSESVELFFSVLNDQGQMAVSRGYARLTAEK